MRFLKRAVVILTLGMVAAAPVANAQDDAFRTTATTNDGKKWRIVYYEGGPHNNYYDYLLATVRGLASLGWLADEDFPAHRDEDAHALWQWLSDDARSDYIQFLPDGFYSAAWDKDVRTRNRTALVQRVTQTDEVDLIIAMGTWAGKDLANDQHDTPTIVMSTSDPLKAGIIKSVHDSGLDHVHARVDPRRYERQVQVFHDIVGFERLGVAYEDTIYGRTYSAIDLVEKVATERGFDVVRCYTQSDTPDQSVAGDSVRQCFEHLADRVDAIYVTMQGGVNSSTIPRARANRQ